MPEMIRGKCPGLPSAAGCFIAAGQADVHGRVYEAGAVFAVSARRFPRLHELGHAFDTTMLDAGEREAFSGILHLRDLLWTWSYEDALGRLIQDPRTLAEAFADAYANCRLHRKVGSGEIWEAGSDYYPTRRMHARVCRLIVAAGRDTGASVAIDGSR